MLVLLLGLGLRVSEAADLQAHHFDADSGKLVVYRAKTDTTTIFELRNAKLAAMCACIEAPQPTGQRLVGSRKDGALMDDVGTRAIRARAGALGIASGIPILAHHDLRRTRAMWMASFGSVRALTGFFGWNSPAMAARYTCQVK